MSDARARLRSVRARAAEANEALKVVRETHEAARTFAGACARQVETLASVDHQTACDRADQIKAALRDGAIPIFDGVPALHNTAARADAESKLEAARMVVDELGANLREAESAVAKIRDEAAAAITDVLVGEASAIADEILALEAKAVLLRARLGGDFSPIGQLRAKLPDSVVNVIGTNGLHTSLIRDPKLTFEADQAARVWKAFAQALETGPDAVLDFEVEIAKAA